MPSYLVSYEGFDKRERVASGDCVLTTVQPITLARWEDQRLRLLNAVRKSTPEVDIQTIRVTSMFQFADS